ncbi:probable LRR receptor-like serine/threonine-protein kinase At3g47570 [Papaver somniferum]|uniref:probable LRR receptor-like serine/threonine-protein kinase At3g47570 n=1 Tax=Papaver somniferum TaxID=3469 RepID=UPI000E700639|nr:probable LRR receptor-like serine/threonine-protein kinase At3g47570 [Papaver somniferum]
MFAKSKAEMKLLIKQLHLIFRVALCNSLVIIIFISCMSTVAMDVDDNISNDRLALLAFKNLIAQDPLGTFSSWNSNNESLHFCEWRGVTCSRRHRSRVTGIDLRSQRLVGSISPYIGNLSFLQDLLLGNNSLHGEIPQQVGRLSRLKRLGLSNNFLDGEIPDNISRCSNLMHLNISHNKLVGSIPKGLGYLSNLIRLGLRDNNLTGEISTSLGNLSSLTSLDISFNSLEGRIPSTLSQLTSLKTLGLALNKFSGTVPSSLYNMSSLIIFAVMTNQLHGSVPFDIGFTLPNLEHFSNADNNFTGTIPTSISNLSNLKVLQLNLNNFVGSVPNNLGDLKSLVILNLSQNKLGSGQPGDLTFLNSLVNCTDLKFLIVHRNNFRGVLPNSIANLTNKLEQLYLSKNPIYGSVPEGIQNLVGLTMLILEDNLFTGSIPQGIGKLQMLRILDFRQNQFSGSIPSTFSNLTRLIEITLPYNNLTGLIPSSLRYCTSLNILDLGNNRLSGSIPKQVFELRSLSRGLSLTNNLLTGSLPVEIGNLKNLELLFLHNNKLSGVIPSAIGECLSLTVVRLDGNFFRGNIPPTMSFLRGLETLNLSRNNLSGTIPTGFESLALRRLNLSYNNLEGVVPKSGVFKNMSAFSIEGNNKLCGGIPDLKLQNCSVPSNRQQRKSTPIQVIIIIIVAVVLFLALIVFILALYWRKKKSKAIQPSTPFDVANQYMGVSYNELFKATNGFNDSTNLLGAGSFGSVYKGVLRRDESNHDVAVKVLHLQQRGATKSFMSECDALRNVRHRNLLKIVTCCSSTDFQGNDFKALVYEFMANGSSENWLHPTANNINKNDRLQLGNLNLERRLGIAVDVASALKYLHHDCQSPIVHRDLKPSNVLLDGDLIAHVGDFGLAKFIPFPSGCSKPLNEQDASSIAIKGSIGYVPPEYGMGGEASTQGDVYSYGILLLEMFTGKRPTDDMFKDGLNIHNFCKMYVLPEHIEEIIDSCLLLDVEEKYHDDGAIINYKMQGIQRIQISRDTVRQILASIIQIGVQCSSELPSDRSSMNEVIVDVQALKNKFHVVGL